MDRRLAVCGCKRARAHVAPAPHPDGIRAVAVCKIDSSISTLNEHGLIDDALNIARRAVKWSLEYRSEDFEVDDIHRAIVAFAQRCDVSLGEPTPTSTVSSDGAGLAGPTGALQLLEVSQVAQPASQAILSFLSNRDLCDLRLSSKGCVDLVKSCVYVNTSDDVHADRLAQWRECFPAAKGVSVTGRPRPTAVAALDESYYPPLSALPSLDPLRDLVSIRMKYVQLTRHTFAFMSRVQVLSLLRCKFVDDADTCMRALPHETVAEDAGIERKLKHLWCLIMQHCEGPPDEIGPHVNDSMLAELRGLRRLEIALSPNVWHSARASVTASSFANLKDLVMLRINGGLKVTDACLAYLQNLVSLHLFANESENSRISGEGIRFLPRLRDLFVAAECFETVDVALFAAFSQLRHLGLVCGDVPIMLSEHFFYCLQNLESLMLHNCDWSGVTNSSLAYVHNTRTLIVDSMPTSHLTADCLDTFSQLTALGLDEVGTRVTRSAAFLVAAVAAFDKGVRRLRLNEDFWWMGHRSTRRRIRGRSVLSDSWLWQQPGLGGWRGGVQYVDLGAGRKSQVPTFAAVSSELEPPDPGIVAVDARPAIVRDAAGAGRGAAASASAAVLGSGPLHFGTKRFWRDTGKSKVSQELQGIAAAFGAGAGAAGAASADVPPSAAAAGGAGPVAAGGGSGEGASTGGMTDDEMALSSAIAASLNITAPASDGVRGSADGSVPAVSAPQSTADGDDRDGGAAADGRGSSASASLAFSVGTSAPSNTNQHHQSAPGKPSSGSKKASKKK